MFTNKYMFLLAGAMVFSSSCKNEELTESQDNDVQLTGTLGQVSEGNSLKTTLVVKDGAYVGSWNVNDTVLVYDGTNAVKFYSTSEGPVRATLKKAKNQPTFTLSNDYMAYYPGENATWNGNGGFDVVIPGTQKFNEEGTVTDDAYPMISKAEGLDLGFYNLCSVIRVNLKCEVPCVITRIVLQSTGEGASRISGNGVATFVDGEPVLEMAPMGTDKYSNIILDCGTEGVTVDKEGTYFFVTLPAGTYKKGTLKAYFSIKNATNATWIFDELEMSRSQVRGLPYDLSVYLSKGDLGNQGDNVD